jgi:integrase
MADVKRLLQACAGGRPKDIRNGAIVTLLMDTGLRASELCRLSLANTDLVTCSLAVMGKGRRMRRCVFSPATAERIRTWLPVRKLFVSTDTPALWCSVGGPTPGRPLTRYGLTLVWRELGARAGLAALSTHDFRRGFAVEAARRRMPLEALRSQGGWKSVDVLLAYMRAMTLEDARDFLPAADLPL